MKKWYSAVGHLRVTEKRRGEKYPVVILCGKENVLDIQEFLLWSILSWRIMSEDKTKLMYQAKIHELKLEFSRCFEDCLNRLKQRGLLSEGLGETEEDALYDLLAELYIAPVSENHLLRLWSLIRLRRAGFPLNTAAKQLFTRDKRTENEKKVMRLSSQTLFSTAEIIKCFDRKKMDFSCDEEILDTLYDDDVTTSYNIADMVRFYPSRREVITAIANLYLRKQIILERV